MAPVRRTLRRMVRPLVAMTLPAMLAATGIACGKGPATQIGTSEDAVTGQDAGRDAGQDTGGLTPQSGAQPVAGVPATDDPCSDCQTGADKVELSDADGFEFETGEAEAARIQAGEPRAGDEQPVTFDAGGGLKGTTGSSNLK